MGGGYFFYIFTVAAKCVWVVACLYANLISSMARASVGEGRGGEAFKWYCFYRALLYEESFMHRE